MAKNNCPRKQACTACFQGGRVMVVKSNQPLKQAYMLIFKVVVVVVAKSDPQKQAYVLVFEGGGGGVDVARRSPSCHAQNECEGWASVTPVTCG